MKEIIKTTSDEAVEIIQPLLNANRNILITGGPGSGKTYLANRLKEMNPCIRPMAYTMMAARLINGKTIHSRYHLPMPGLNYEPRQFYNKQTVLYDEISTISVELFIELDKLNGNKTNYIFMGDPYQLPPVTGEPLFEFLNDEQLASSLDLVRIELTKNYRQKESIFYQEILRELREHGRTERVEKFIKERTNIPIPEYALEDSLYVAPLNRDVKIYNGYFDKYQPGTLVRGFDNRNRMKNNEMGLTLGYDGESKMLKVKLFRGGETISKLSKGNEVDSPILDICPDHVVPAEAVTLYRIQGQTLKNIIINLNQIYLFNNGLYVAMSRVSSENNVFFVNEGILSNQISFLHRITGGSSAAGVSIKIRKGNINTTEKRSGDYEESDEFTNNSFCIHKKKYGSNAMESTMLLLSNYYLGINNGFTKWKRDALLQQKGLKKRTSYCKKDRYGRYQKKKYEYDEKPLPFFVYTSDCTKPHLNTKEVREDSVFESLNPMKPETPVNKRLSVNCDSKTRFLFETDYNEKLPRRKKNELRTADLALAKELERKGIVNRITFSGRISYHCIVETSYEVPDYKVFWHWMNKKYFGGKADTKCASPSFWTRTPGRKRPETGKIQRGYGNYNRVFDPTEELEEMAREQEKKTIETKRNHDPKNRDELFRQAIEISKTRKLKLQPRAKMKQEARELLDERFPLDGFIEWGKTAINCLHGRGYSSDEIWQLLEKAGKDKKGRDRRDKVKRFVFNNRPY